MTLKQFRVIKIVMAILLGIIAAEAATSGIYWIVAVAITLAIISTLAIRSQVKEIIADERDYEIAGKSARYAMSAWSFIGCILAMVFMSLRETNQLYGTIGSVIAYMICAYLIFYSIIFTFLSKKHSK